MSNRLMAMVAAVSMAWSGGASAATIHVYPGGSIQAAIDGAQTDDEIVVHAGTYAGLIDFRGKSVTLRSAAGADATVLDGQQAGTVVQCMSGEGPGTVVEGFLITGGRGTSTGGGMHIAGASPTIRQCVFRDNAAQYGGGVFSEFGQPSFVQCTFDHNSADVSGGGAYCYGYPGQASARLVECVFSGNSAQGYGGGIRNWDSSPTLERCDIYGNYARQAGGGMANGGASHPNCTNCIFEGNRADTLFGNWDSAGGGVNNTDTSSPLLVNCVFVANSAVALLPHLSRGGALANSGSASPTLVNCTLKANHANLGYALANAGTAAPTLLNSIVWSSGDEVLNEGSATVTMTYSDVDGGWPGLGNLNSDPRWDDLRLAADSPCIDAGDPTYAPAGAHDLDGHARVLRGRVDMGAYEFGIGDHDGNRAVNGQDFVSGDGCLTGPDNGPYATGCETLDFEYDLDVDLVDMAALQRAVTERG